MPPIDFLKGVSAPAVEGNFVIIKQPDGNYIGTAWKFGKEITVRDIDPQTVLTRLLTHGGE